MSTIVYARVTGRRIGAALNEEQPPGLRTYVDLFAALVPAEVLSVHAILLTFMTKIEKGETTITEPQILAVFFWVLAALSIGLYFVGRYGSKLELWDIPRALIPPLAFVGWTMLQRPTAFDAVVPVIKEALRIAIAVVGAVALGAAALLLARIDDNTKVRQQKKRMKKEEPKVRKRAAPQSKPPIEDPLHQ